MYIHRYINASVHKYIHTCTHTYIHTHTHTYEVMNHCRPTYMHIQNRIHIIIIIIMYIVFLTDINECDNSRICDDRCINTIGSFFCECYPGYQLNDDLMTCSGMKNT